MMQLQKHMFSDMEGYDWLTGRVAAVGRCYGLVIELQRFHQKTTTLGQGLLAPLIFSDFSELL